MRASAALTGRRIVGSSRGIRSRDARPLPRACRDPEPAGRGARRRGRRAALPARSRPRAGRGRLRPRDRLDDGQHLRPARADRGGHAALLLRPSRHRAAVGAARARRRGRRRAERRRHDPRRRQQVGGRAMLEGVRRVLAENRPHAGIELAVHAEGGGRPGRRLRVRPRPPARASSATSTTRRRRSARSSSARRGRESMEVRFHGRAAHSGMFPEEGRSAIQAAAKAIADLRLGRVDEETTANVGVISGGTAGNIVPEWCTFLAEARSQDERKLARPRAGDARRVLVRRDRDGLRGRDGSSARATAATGSSATTTSCGSRRRRSRACGYEPSYALSGGGADANVFNERGRRCANLANGMTDIHTPDERIAVEDLDGDGRGDARARRRGARA